MAPYQLYFYIVIIVFTKKCWFLYVPKVQAHKKSFLTILRRAIYFLPQSVLLWSWKGRKSEHDQISHRSIHFLCCCMKETKQEHTVAGCPISRARCRRGRRSSCSTSALLDTDHHDSSTRHTLGFPGAEHSDPASLTHQRQKHTQLQNTQSTTDATGGVFGGFCHFPYV